MKEELLTFIRDEVLSVSKFDSSTRNEKFWVERRPELLIFLKSISRDCTLTLSQQIFDFVNGFNVTPPKCNTCNVELTKFHSSRGYAQYCSSKCAANNIKTKEMKKSTMVDRYGADSTLLVPEIKERFLTTMVERYGVQYGGQSQELNDKAKQTCLIKYGVSHASKLKENRDQAKETIKDRFGHSCWFNRNKTQEQVELISNFEFMSSHSNNEISEITGFSLDHVRKMLISLGIYLPNEFRSIQEKEVVDYIRSIYNGEILINSRKVISPFELDIYLPEIGLAIEINGDFWHSENAGCAKEKHIEKFRLCNEVDIKLFQIFAYQWNNKTINSIWKSKILNELKSSIVVGARLCKLREISTEEASEFFNQNHLYGYCNSNIKIGLFKDDILLSAMTFGRSRFNSNEIELLRFANKLGTSVVGGASKLLKYAKENFNLSDIVSFSDNSYSDGNLYRQLGFTKVSESIGYFYVKDGIRYNRMSFQKHKLKDKLENFDPTLTESQNMMNNGYLKIYDAGQTKWKI